MCMILGGEIKRVPLNEKFENQCSHASSITTQLGLTVSLSFLRFGPVLLTLYSQQLPGTAHGPPCLRLSLMLDRIPLPSPRALFRASGSALSLPATCIHHQLPGAAALVLEFEQSLA